MYTVDGDKRDNVVQLHTESKKNTHPPNNGIVNGNQIVVEIENNVPVYKTNGMLPNS